ncbi:IS5 family transposase [Pseudomonas caspiana]|nr:IS5 family transposase [Pseudomonas caspiana]
MATPLTLAQRYDYGRGRPSHWLRSAGLKRLIKPAGPEGALNVLIDSTGLKVFGAGQWVQEKHGAKSRRGWRKLHIAVDVESFSIVAHTLTTQEVDDPSQVGPLLDQIEAPLRKITADGAYDGAPTYEVIAARDEWIVIAIPPRSTAVPSGSDPPTHRDLCLKTIQTQGRLAWQACVDYGKRALVETMMSVYKTLVGVRLRARGWAAQQTEVAIGVAVVNRMLAVARPHSVRKMAMR